MEDLIPLVNRLQDVFSVIGAEPIELPQIVVVGSQSSGKTSVLESFVGRDFLPRGTGIVTRRPLILQLRHLENPDSEDRAVFLHRPDIVYADYDDIRQEITAETDRVVRSTRSISPEPIVLKLWSPRVLDLTVVDLPGIVRNAIDGQDPAIVEQIQTLVHKFIAPPTTLILAVTPATEDLANSEALLAARSVDPDGDRTIGVITKLDLMDAGTDARSVLTGQTVPLHLGFIGVVNRSQKDLNDRTCLDDARERERSFFANSPHYSDLADRCGSSYLCRSLAGHLRAQIRASLPSLRINVRARLSERRAELRTYGEQLSPSSLRTTAMDAIGRYLDAFESVLRGSPGGRIAHHFTDAFAASIDSVPGPRALETRAAFAILRGRAGITVPLFTPNDGIELIVGTAVEELKAPSARLVFEVAEMLVEAHLGVAAPEIARFPGLRETIQNAAETCVQERVEPARVVGEEFVECQKVVIGIAEMGKWRMVASNPRERPQPEKPRCRTAVDICTLFGTARSVTAAQEAEIGEVIAIAAGCFNVVRETIKDFVPKTVVKCLVRESGEMLRAKLMEAVFEEGDITELLKEDPRTTTNRDACRAALATLETAEAILTEAMEHPE
jgi:dynamin 1-like protein